MGIIKALKLMHDYYKYDENGHIEETHRALDDINLDIEQGQFIAVLGHNGSGNRRWQSISMRFYIQQRVQW